jgi:hypothetical protein
VLPDVSERTATEWHAMAVAQTGFLDQVLAGVAANYANGFPIPLGVDGFKTLAGGGGSGAMAGAPASATLPPAMAQLFGNRCACPDCESAVSPAAYLADLLDYTLKHLRNNGGEIDPPFLADLLCQPVGDLPADCEAVDKRVRQVRLAVEVLRCYLGTRPLVEPTREQKLAAAESAYRLAAYSLLLAQLGTTYDEIRRVRHAPADDRKALAERLGIELTQPADAGPVRFDELDQLFLDPDLPPTEPGALTEAALESLFGLVDTNPAPLSEGIKAGDTGGQIRRWKLDGVRWGTNTDANGQVYISLIQTTMPTMFRVFVYADEARRQVVALGERDTPTGPVKLIPENSSGLSGVFEIAYTADTATVTIAVVSKLLVWQLRHLWTLWQKQDWSAETASTAAGRAPVVDPDVVASSDLRTMRAANPAAALLQERQHWLERQRQALHGARSAAATPLAGLDDIIAQVFSTPGAAANLHALQKDEEAGRSITARLEPYHLTYPAFTFLGYPLKAGHRYTTMVSGL